MLKIAVGTTSKWKLSGIKEILEEAGIEAELIPVNAPSNISSQPRTENETIKGAVNRAKNALKLVKDAEIGLGIEIGYEPVKEKLFMHGWSAIVDSENNIYAEQSSTLELPKYFLKYLNDHDEVGHHVGEYENMKQDLSWKFFARIIRFRMPFIKESFRNTILRYYFRNEY